jgi:hypothetical protein
MIRHRLVLALLAVFTLAHVAACDGETGPVDDEDEAGPELDLVEPEARAAGWCEGGISAEDDWCAPIDDPGDTNSYTPCSVNAHCPVGEACVLASPAYFSGTCRTRCGARGRCTYTQTCGYHGTSTVKTCG